MSESPSSPPSAPMKGRLVVGGVAVVALAALLSGLFNGFGGGPGLGGSLGTGDGKSDKADEDPEGKKDDPATKKDDETKADALAAEGPLRIVVEPDGYSVVGESEDGDRTYTKTELAVAVAAAKTAKMDPDGYKVYITIRRGTSIADHQKLVQALEAGGLEPDEINGYDDKDVPLESNG